jgi:hypothetical protein
MFRFTVALDDALRALETDVAYAAHELGADLLAGAHDAAEYGVKSMQDSHPYTDRTRHLTDDMFVGDATGPDGDAEAEIVVPAEYGAYVNYGTSRSRPYPFVPLGEHTAEEALVANTDKAVAKYAAKIRR